MAMNKVCLNGNRQTILRAAIGHLPCVEFHLTRKRGGTLNDLLSLPRKVREIVWQELHEQDGSFTSVKVFSQILDSSNKRYFILGEGTVGHWTPLNDEAAWPPSNHMLNLLMQQTAPYKCQSKGYFSERNVGMGELVNAVAWSLLLHFDYTWTQWISFMPAMFAIMGIYHLSKYFVLNKLAHEKRQLRVFEAIKAEGMNFAPAEERRTVVPLKPNPAA